MRQEVYKALVEIRIVQKLLVVNPKGRDYLINLSVYDRLMFKTNLGNRWNKVTLCQFRIKSS
jgi:hypothetical protein